MDKPKLRSALKKLMAVPYDTADFANAAAAPQEMLDILATVAGLKPVFLLGRGFDDPSRVRGVSDIAAGMGLHVRVGPFWTSAGPSELPDWLVDINAGKNADKKAVYITRTRSAADEVIRINTTGGRISVEDEARLLGYPACCVSHHYANVARVDRLYSLLLKRVGGGDEARMRQLVLDDVEMAPETEEEIALARTFEMPMASQIPYSSINACPACETNPDSPARRVAAKFKALAEAVDHAFAARIGMMVMDVRTRA